MAYLLNHLPFVRVDGSEASSTLSLINPRSISKSHLIDFGAAQCFLVVTMASFTSTQDSSDESDKKLSIRQRVVEFVSKSEFGKHLRLLASGNDKDKENGNRNSTLLGNKSSSA